MFAGMLSKPMPPPANRLGFAPVNWMPLHGNRVLVAYVRQRRRWALVIGMVTGIDAFYRHHQLWLTIRIISSTFTTPFGSTFICQKG